MKRVDVCHRCVARHRSKILRDIASTERVTGPCDWCGHPSVDLWPLGIREPCPDCQGKGTQGGCTRRELANMRDIYGSDNCGACGGLGWF